MSKHTARRQLSSLRFTRSALLMFYIIILPPSHKSTHTESLLQTQTCQSIMLVNENEYKCVFSFSYLFLLPRDFDEGCSKVEYLFMVTVKTHLFSLFLRPVTFKLSYSQGRLYNPAHPSQLLNVFRITSRGVF